MTSPFQMIWDAVLAPLLQRPKRLQMAALCHRGEGASKEYLLVTSRDTARWIIPKGWPIRGFKSNETALREAWEEAGLKELSEEYPEAHERTRKWVDADTAADMVDESELKSIFRRQSANSAI